MCRGFVLFKALPHATSLSFFIHGKSFQLMVGTAVKDLWCDSNSRFKIRFERFMMQELRIS